MSRLCRLLLACGIAVLPACGKEKEPPPRVFEVKAPGAFDRQEFPEAGLAFERPRNWSLREREAPGVLELASGEAIVAVWAYPRDEPLPATASELESAKGRLLDEIERRDPDYEVRTAATRRVAGAPAIVVRGDQVISNRRLRTRSVHVFDGGAEYVIEAISPPRDQRLVVKRVLAPLLRSLELDGEALVEERE